MKNRNDYSDNAMDAVIRIYNPYSTNREMACLLYDALGMKVEQSEARSRINAYALRFYHNEAIVKYALVGHILSREKCDEVAFFEFPVGSNRADLCRVNGCSIAYEIKTEFDSFERLDAQMHAYASVFDYVYVVVPHSRYAEARRFVFSNVGVITYKPLACGFSFAYRKRAEKNQLDSAAQLSCLSLKGLREIAAFVGVEREKEVFRDDLESRLTDWSVTHGAEINAAFKRELKARYRRKWQKLHEWYRIVEPLDMQASFSSETLVSA